MSKELTDAIDAALIFVTSAAWEMTEAQVDQLHSLGANVYRLALADGFADALPKVQDLRPEVEELSPEAKERGVILRAPSYVSKLNVPGDWSTDTPQVFQPFIPERWEKDMEVLRWLSSGSKSKSETRAGRPSKEETPKDTLVLAALCLHHQYKDGSIGNATPIILKQFGRAGHGFSDATVSRFLEKKFPGRGYKGYVAACNQRARVSIGQLLAKWQGEEQSHHATLDERD